jgi:hypothetical protein
MLKKVVSSLAVSIICLMVFSSSTLAATYYDTQISTLVSGYNRITNYTSNSDFSHWVYYYVTKKSSTSYYFDSYSVVPTKVASTADPYWGTTFVADENEIYYDDNISGRFVNNMGGILENVSQTLEEGGPKSGGYPYGWVEILHGYSQPGGTANKTVVRTFFN